MKFKYTKHKKMWDYIINNVEELVDDFGHDIELDEAENRLIELKEKFLSNDGIINDCYACDYVYKEHKSPIDCSNCPLIIGNCKYKDSLYDNLLKSIELCDISDAIHYCTKIRDAKVRDGVEWE